MLRKILTKRITPINYNDFIKQTSNIAIAIERYNKRNTSFEVICYKSAPSEPHFVHGDDMEEMITDSNNQLVNHRHQSLAEMTKIAFKEAKYVKVIIRTTNDNDVFLCILSLDKKHKRQLSWYLQDNNDRGATSILDSVKKKIGWLFTIN